VAYALTVTNLGLDVVGIGRVATSVEPLPGIRKAVRSRRLAVACVVSPVLFAGLTMSKIPALAALGACLTPFPLVFRDDWYLMARGKEKRVAISSVVRDAIFLALVLGVVGATKNLTAAVWSFLGAEVVWSIYLQRQIRGLAEAESAPASAEEAARLLRAGWPLAIVALMSLTAGRVGTGMVSLMVGAASAGGFYASYRILIAAQAITAPIGRIALPLIARTGKSPDQNDRRELQDIRLLTTLAGCVGGLALANVSGMIIRGIYGDQFAASGPILRILSISAALGVIYAIPYQAVLAQGATRALLILAVVGACTNLAAVALLVPRMGAVGAAWGCAAADLVMLVGVSLIYRAGIERLWDMLSTFAVISAAVLAFVASTWLFPRAPLANLALSCGTTIATGLLIYRLQELYAKPTAVAVSVRA